MPGQQVQGVQIHGRTGDDVATLTPDGAITRLDVSALVVGDIVWDAITPTFNATSDVYQFYLNSVLQKTITINYTDATKEVMSGITKV